MTIEQKNIFTRILISSIFLTTALFTSSEYNLIFFLVSYGIIGWNVLWNAIRNIAHGKIFDENFLMSIATIGAFLTGEYPEGVAVMLFYQIGELFQDYAVDRSRKSIVSLMDIRPDYANLEKDGTSKRVKPDSILIGDIIIIKAGEKIPLDGIILEGNSSIDTAALTGEAMPRDVQPGDDIISGCINQSGLLRVRVTKAFGESTVAKIMELVENSADKKSHAENFITRFAHYYTPIVVLAAALLAVVPPLFFNGLWTEWIHRALIFLVISCPCALVISVPLSFFGGIGGASKKGILIKGGNYLEILSHTEIIVFDKTGTLTKGVFNVTAIHPDQFSQAELLEFAALAESYSDHPISRSIRDTYNQAIDSSRITNVIEHAGRGIAATVDGHNICVGNDKFMEEIGVKWHPCHHMGTTVHIAVDQIYAGHIVISDEVKSDAAQTIATLKKMGIRKTVMLTGDMKSVGEKVAQALCIDEAHTQLLPADKVKIVEKLLQEKTSGGKLIFVGDGINDAPVLSRADIGIAMGAMGSDAAIEAADIVLMDDKLSNLAIAIEISKKTLSIVHQNVIFALSIKALVLLLGAFGIANMWGAVFADVGVSILAILNASRAFIVKK